jgi:23S rRNA G2445 N2-methylase RlmL
MGLSPQDAYYLGADVNDLQLLGACDNLEAAGLRDKIELLKVSIVGKVLK